MGAELSFIRMKTQNKFSPIGASGGAGSHRPCDRPLSRAFQRYQKRVKRCRGLGDLKAPNKQTHLPVEIVRRGT
jgi:hypothetical protein